MQCSNPMEIWGFFLYDQHDIIDMMHIFSYSLDYSNIYFSRGIFNLNNIYLHSCEFPCLCLHLVLGGIWYCSYMDKSLFSWDFVCDLSIGEYILYLFIVIIFFSSFCYFANHWNACAMHTQSTHLANVQNLPWRFIVIETKSKWCSIIKQMRKSSKKNLILKHFSFWFGLLMKTFLFIQVTSNLQYVYTLYT